MPGMDVTSAIGPAFDNMVRVLFLLIIVDVLTRHFVTAAMYARQTRIMAAWNIVLPILRENLGQVLLYFLLLFAFGFGIGLASLIVALMVLAFLAIPFGGLALIGFLIG